MGALDLTRHRQTGCGLGVPSWGQKLCSLIEGRWGVRMGGTFLRKRPQAALWVPRGAPKQREAPWTPPSHFGKAPWCPLLGKAPCAVVYRVVCLPSGGWGGADCREFIKEPQLKVVALLLSPQGSNSDVSDKALLCCHRGYFSDVPRLGVGVHAGAWSGSRFPGQGGTEVLTAEGSELPPSLESYPHPSLSSQGGWSHRETDLRDTSALRVDTSVGSVQPWLRPPALLSPFPLSVLLSLPPAFPPQIPCTQTPVLG